VKDFFVNQGVKELEIEKFIRENFPVGDYSKTELQRTPLGMRIIIWTNKPGRIIGRGGKTINEITEALKQRFGLENPQVDVKLVENPDLDAKIMAKQIATAIERGFNYKRIGNLALRRIMEAGAVGAEIVISGKLGGAKAMTAKFREGHLEICGEPRKRLVDEAFEEAETKPGKIGVRVRIMCEYEDVTGRRLKPKELREREEKWLIEEAEKVEKAEEEEI